MKIFTSLPTNLPKKDFIFITGAPRSGTSMITKVIDSHPDIAILMENIFCNRRRHWIRASFWNSKNSLRRKADKVFSRLKEPVIGNKVCTPDVWSADDICLFCSLFKTVKIIFVIRDPSQVALSRYYRENYLKEFSANAKNYILLNFASQFLTYTSSWRQSVENYWRLRDKYKSQIYLVYYEDFCHNFELEIEKLFTFLSLPISKDIFTWYKQPHHDSNGNLVKNLKYSDNPVKLKVNDIDRLPTYLRTEFNDAIESINIFHDLWSKRML